MRKSLRVFGMSLSAALAGCALLSGPDGYRVVGIVERVAPDFSHAVRDDAGAAYPRSTVTVSTDQLEEPPVLEAPDTVTAGVSFEVLVRTYGADGCWREAGGQVSAADMTIGITPYDTEDDQRGVSCSMALVRLPRQFTISFPRAGQGLLRVTGRKVFDGAGTELREETLTIEKQVIVR